jgi:hypothetical protein
MRPSGKLQGEPRNGEARMKAHEDMIDLLALVLHHKNDTFPTAPRQR